VEHSAGFFTEIDRSVLSATIATYQSLACWRPDPTIQKSEYERLLDVFSYSGLISSRHAYDLAIVPPPGYLEK
jgi:hypothetical protein